MNNISVRNNKKGIIIHFCLLIVAVLFALFFYRGTSPLFSYYTYDSSVFMTMGTMLLNGKIMYVDCFDHKGIVLYLIEALGQLLIPGRWGIFILQVVNLFLILVFIYKTTKIFQISKNKIVFIIISFLLLFKLSLDEGNQTEEYCMLFSSISLYITFRYYYKTKTLSVKDIFILGLCFSLSFWIRPNNAGVSSICIAFIFLVLARQGNKRFLIKYSSIVFISIIAFCVAICIYFVAKDAFDAMIYSLFSYNFKYIDKGYQTNLKELSKTMILNVSVVGVWVLATYLSYKKNPKKDYNLIIFIILLLLLGVFPVNMRFGHCYYLSLLTPVYAVGMMLLFSIMDFSKKQNKILNAFSALLFIALLCSGFFRFNTYRTMDDAYIESAKNIVSMVPSAQLDNVYGYQTEAKLYVVTDLKPTFRYFFLQDFLAKSDKRINDSVKENIESDNTLWVITQNDVFKKSTNEGALDALSQNYEKYFSDNYLTLFKRK